jgi:DNA topoisomerase-1
LRIIKSKATRKRFVGCEGYPDDCTQTYPLPQRGDILATGETCPSCGTPRIKILGGKRPWILCLDPECPTKAEYREKQAARLAARAPGAVAKAGPAPKKAASKRKTTVKKTTAAKSTTAKKAAAPKKAAAAKKVAAPKKAAAPKETMVGAFLGEDQNE